MSHWLARSATYLSHRSRFKSPFRLGTLAKLNAKITIN